MAFPDTVTATRRTNGYSEKALAVYAKDSIAKNITSKNIIVSKGGQIKVFVGALGTVAEYTPGTGVALSQENGAYVTLTNTKEMALNQVIDGYSAKEAPENYKAMAIIGGTKAIAKVADIDLFTSLVAEGTETFAAAIVKTDKTTIVARILKFAEELNVLEAPEEGRHLILSPAMWTVLMQADGFILSTETSQMILDTAYRGMFLGFNIHVTGRLTGANMVGLHEDSAGFIERFTVPVSIIDLNDSTHVGDSKAQGRLVYNYGVVRPLGVLKDISAA